MIDQSELSIWVLFHEFDVRGDHFLDEILEGYFRFPSQDLARLCRIAEQLVNLGRTEEFGRQFDPDNAGFLVFPDFVYPGSGPGDFDANFATEKI